MDISTLIPLAIERDSVFYIFFWGILQNLLIFGAIPIGILIFIMIGIRQHKNDIKMYEKILELEEKGKFEEAFEQLKVYIESSTPEEENYLHLATLCKKGKEAGWKHPEKEYDPYHWYKLAADEGNKQAKFELQKEKYENYYPRNMAKAMNAVEEIRALAKEGVGEAKGFVSEFESKARKIYSSAYEYENEGDYVEAYSKYAFYMRHIKGAPGDYYHMAEICRKGKESGWNLSGKEYGYVYWLEKAAEKGHRIAKLTLLKMKLEDVYPKNIMECAKIVDEIRTLAEGGLSEAKIFLDELKNRLEKDYHERKFNLFERFAIIFGAESWTELGMHLEEEGKIKEAMEWYVLASEKNNAEAEFAMALIYLEGRPGICKDYEKGIEWLEKASTVGECGYKKLLAKIFCSGEIVEPNYLKAAEWYVRAGEQGDAESYHNAYLTLNIHAMMLANKKGLDTVEKYYEDEEICEYLSLAYACEEKAKEMGFDPDAKEE